MVYLMQDKEKGGFILVVKANSEEKVREMLNLKEGVEIVGRLTHSDISTLSSSAFAVIES